MEVQPPPIQADAYPLPRSTLPKLQRSRHYQIPLYLEWFVMKINKLSYIECTKEKKRRKEGMKKKKALTSSARTVTLPLSVNTAAAALLYPCLARRLLHSLPSSVTAWPACSSSTRYTSKISRDACTNIARFTRTVCRTYHSLWPTLPYCPPPSPSRPALPLRTMWSNELLGKLGNVQ